MFSIKKYNIRNKNNNIFFKYNKEWIINLLLCLYKTNIFHYHLIINILSNLKFNNMLDYDIMMIISSLCNYKYNNELYDNFYLNLKNRQKILDLISSKYEINFLIEKIFIKPLLCFDKKFFILYFVNFRNYTNNCKKLIFLFNDVNFLYEVIKIKPEHYNFYIYKNEIRYNKDIINLVKNKIKLNNKNFPLEFNDDKEFILNNTKLGFIKSIKYASKRLKKDKEFNKELIKINYKIKI